MAETQKQESISDRPEEEQYGEDDWVDEDDSDEYSSDRADLSENARRFAHEYSIDSPCPNFQNVGPIASSHFYVTFRDFSCNCQFCGPILPKVLDIAERERPGEEIRSIYGIVLRFKPISMNIVFTNGPWLEISLYSPTGCSMGIFAEKLPRRDQSLPGVRAVESMDRLLCILQNSTDDWEMQSVCMAKIYQDATVVIAASSAHGAHDGFLGLRKQYFDDCLISPDSNSKGLYAMPEIHSYDPARGQTLSTRAWAFQERLLARRYLSFDQKELHWECELSWYCECGVSDWNGNEVDTYSLRRLCGTATSQDQAYYFWRATIVPYYSERALSVTSDRLPALSAIARVFQDKLQDTYLAGLWKRDLLKGLCWSRGSIYDEHPDSPRGNIAPTWTWCAVEGPAYNQVFDAKFMAHSQCLGAECTPSGINDLGEVRDGFITLRGPLVKAFVGLSTDGINLGEWIQIWASRKQDGNPNGLRQICKFKPDGVVVKKPEGNRDVPSESRVVLTTWQAVESSLEATQLDVLGSWDTNNAIHTFAPVWCLHIGEDIDAATGLHSLALVLSTSPKSPERFIRIGFSWVKKGGHNDLHIALAYIAYNQRGMRRYDYEDKWDEYDMNEKEGKGEDGEFYQTFNLIFTLLSGLSLSVLTFDEFHNEQKHSDLVDASAGLMTSSAITAVVAVMTVTMLLFKFEGHVDPAWMDLAISWIPLILVDTAILEFLVGMVLWYTAKYSTTSTAIISLQLGILLVGTMLMAVWMWKTMRQEFGLGAEERII
ncbi:hypothetical protein PG993_000227 [Apiospora rasikravindrae]|uniref:Heterokaryon incompatibility domain-containing protein n=1 Tax=Apiospora rasikravindrae TaxID=990691 RepID=A0ABR1U7Z9_9PEZI